MTYFDHALAPGATFSPVITVGVGGKNGAATAWRVQVTDDPGGGTSRVQCTGALDTTIITKRLSLSVEGTPHLNKPVTVTAKALDAEGNAVPDGTEVRFQAAGTGSESPSEFSALTANGSAAFQFTSSKVGTSEVVATTAEDSAVIWVDWVRDPATLSISSCQGAVTPSVIEGNTQSSLQFEVTNHDAEDNVRWIRFTSPSTNIRIRQASSVALWSHSVSTSTVTYFDHALLPGETFAAVISVEVGGTNGTSTNWRIQVTQDPGGGSDRVGCSGDLDTRIHFRPSQPRDLTASTNLGTIALTWRVPESDGGLQILAYQIYRAVGLGEFSLLGQTSTLSYTDDSCPSATLCAYHVTAANELGQGPPSANVTGFSVKSPLGI